jgi:hypothetical protein
VKLESARGLPIHASYLVESSRMNKTGISVCCRFRPQNKLEKQQNGELIMDITGGNIALKKQFSENKESSFNFDHVFDIDSTQVSKL